MPSTFSTRLRMERQATGENLDTWGLIVNEAVIDLADIAIAGVVTIPVAATNVVLTTANGTEDQARYAILNVTGTLSADVDIIIPNTQKQYVVYNGTSGSFDLGIRTSSGTAAVVPAGLSFGVWCDGSNNTRLIGLTSAGDVAGAIAAAITAHDEDTDAHYPASETQRGFIELATSAEVITGADTTRGVTPAGLASLTATTTRRGLVELATNAEAGAGTDTERAITPAALASAIAAFGVIGAPSFASSLGANSFSFTIPGATPIRVDGGIMALQTGGAQFNNTFVFDSPFDSIPFVYVSFNRTDLGLINYTTASVIDTTVSAAGFDYTVYEREGNGTTSGRVMWLAIGAP